MNKSEKLALIFTLFIFSVGFAARYFPWDLPEIGELPVEFRELPPAAYQTSDEAPKELVVSEEVVPTGKPAVAKKSGKKRAAKKHYPLPVPLNSASAEHLCAISGVGPKLAQKIIEYRTEHGPFKSEADLRKVPGIGEKKSKTILQNAIFD